MIRTYKRFSVLIKQSMGDFSLYFKEIRLSLYFIIFLMILNAIKGLFISEEFGLLTILFSILYFILLLIFTVDILLVRKSHDLNLPKEGVLNNMLTFTLTGFACLAIVLLGLIFFIVPGIIALLYLYLAPLISIYETQEGLAPLKKSKFLIGKEELFLTFLLFFTPLLMQFLFLKSAHFLEGDIKIIFMIFSAALLGFVHVLITLMSVRLYFYLRSVRISSLVLEDE